MARQMIIIIMTVAVYFWGRCEAAKHHFKDSEYVPLYVNNIGPYYNPSETYDYYSMPVCQPTKFRYKKESLGEVLDGDRLKDSLYNIKFKKNIKNELLCTKLLKAADVNKLHKAIDANYYFEFVIDDLPMWNVLGSLQNTVETFSHTVLLWRHQHFSFYYNEDRIIAVNLTVTSNGVELPYDDVSPKDDMTVNFTYSVSWEKTTTSFDDRMNVYASNSIFPKSLEIHWLSIINSCVLVLLLTMFVAMIMTRVLRSDYARYEDEEAEMEDAESYGWKLIHGDVFRFPPHMNLFCAFLGNGAQFLLLTACILILSLLGSFDMHHRHGFSSAAVILYALTSGVAGLVSSSFYKRMGGEKWAWNVLLTWSIFSGPFFIVWSFLNSLVWAYRSTQALPFVTVIQLMLIWLFVGFPLTVLGGIAGKNMFGRFDAPCRTKNIPREIPTTPIYCTAPMQMLLGGFLPFSAISIELYYIFATTWGRESYTLYGILVFVFIILVIVTSCVSVSLVYFQLAAEDYRWWWRSFMNLGSVGIFVYLYAVYYYVWRSNMHGVVQTMLFMGYTLMICYAFFLALGSVGFYSAFTFVRLIYRNVKCE